MNELLEQFLLESRDLVEQASEDLLALEQTPDDRARLDSAFRAFHTLKGAAGIIDFAAMGRAMHAAEDLLAAVRAGDHAVTPDLIGGCLACLDQIVRWLDAMEAGGEPPPDADAVAAGLVARLASRGAAEPAAVSNVGEGRPAWIDRLVAANPAAAATIAVCYAPDADCFYRGEDPLALIRGLPGLLALDLQPRQPWPPLDELNPFACNLTIYALASGSAADAAGHLRPARDQARIYALPQHAPAAGSNPSGSILSDRAAAILRAQVALVSQVAGDAFEGRLGSAGRVAGNVLRHAGLEAEAAEIDKAVTASLAARDPEMFRSALEAILKAPAGPGPEGAGGGAAASASPEAAARALRVDVERIDAIVMLTGELTIAKNALGHTLRLAQEGGDPRALAETLKHQHALLDRLTAELQRSVLAIRLVPLRHIFHRFPRLVREMAGSLGKTVHLVTEGEATEADKAVVEALFEPLLHVLRNAVDHGVESTGKRAATGKPEKAPIRLSGYREGEHVIVEVRDDGAGIDAGEVRRAAAARGLATAEALAALTEDELVDLIFRPGFSTAASVTDISGRGVGMDAVRTAVERLGGRVAVSSRKGEGTLVRFVLPLTVMMTRVMTVEAAGQVFGVPFEVVVETLQLPRESIVPIGAAQAFVLRGRTVPLINLAQTLELEGRSETSPVAKAIVVQVGGQLGALEVDRLGERLDVMLKPMDGLLSGTTGVAGTTLLGDGRVLIVLDLPELLH